MLFVPTSEPIQSPNYAPLPEARVFSSPSKPLASHAPSHTLVTQEASGSPGDIAKLKIRLDLTKIKIISLTLVCAQGKLIISDGVHVTLLNNRDHVIDITNWNFENIFVKQIEKTARRILFTIVVTSASVIDGRTSSETENFEVTFAVIEKGRDTNYSDIASHDLGSRVELDTLSSFAQTDIFVAEAPDIEPREISKNIYPKHDQPNDKESENNTKTSIVIPSTQASKDDLSAPPPKVEIKAFVSRARDLIQRGDISSARLLLERARAHNTPEATFLLAQTYDPERLRDWKVYGLRANLDLARDLYARAAEQGYTDARRLAVKNR